MAMTSRTSSGSRAQPRGGPGFDASAHLSLEVPTRLVNLGALGNPRQSAADLATDFAQTNCFRVLSDEGARVLAAEVSRLEHFAVESARIPRVLRGTTWKSEFIHGLCHSPALAAFVSGIARCELIAHPMEIMNGHINLAPRDPSRSVDRWHYDTTPFVLVLFVSSPSHYDGGEFEYFVGPLDEAERLLKENRGELPAERCATVGAQTQGHAVFQQGSQVFHRARRVTRGTERTTFVQSFVASTRANARDWEGRVRRLK